MEKEEFYRYTKDILEHEEFQKLRTFVHHGLNRYDHSLRVARISYGITRFLGLDKEKTARAALLHDFFLEDSVELGKKEKLKMLVKHPQYALATAKKYFSLSELEEDIIVSHMFPIGIRLPRYLESWIVDLTDDVVAVYEKCYGFQKQISFATSFLFLFLLNSFR